MRKWLIRIAAVSVMLGVIGFVVLLLVFRGSLSALKGEQVLPGLSGTVQVERDSLGIPAIRAESQLDMVRATGFVHGQDRLFQMDLFRRTAAGELSAWIPAARTMDEQLRLHGFRRLAQAQLERLPEEDRRLLAAYAEGVNSGYDALRTRPIEYLALRLVPEPWRPEDSILVAYTMFMELEGGFARARLSTAVMNELLPEPVLRFFTRNGNRWDAAIDGSVRPLLPVPEEVFWADLLREVPEEREPILPGPERSGAGSNAWAVSGSRTADGRPLLAGDPHLPLRVPNIWYRVDQQWKEDDGQFSRVAGVTIPGAPFVIIGTNGRVAWSMTSAYANTQDLVTLIPDPQNEGYFLAATESFQLIPRQETIQVRGEDPVVVEFQDSPFGPVVGHDTRGRPLALTWTPWEEDGFNLAWGGVHRANNIRELFAIANRAGIPVQNLIAADSMGNIGWTIAGWLPRRIGYDGFLPVRSDSSVWRRAGRLPPDRYPRMINPATGRIWNSNNRVVSGEALRRIGDGYPRHDARGWIISNRLSELTEATPEDMRQLQLSTSGVHLERWASLLREVLAGFPPEDAAAARAARHLAEWDGDANVDSVAFRLAHEFRIATAQRVYGRLLAPVRRAYHNFRLNDIPWEEPLWILLRERPEFLADPVAGSWSSELREVAQTLLLPYQDRPERLDSRTWGIVNPLNMRHPMSEALPHLANMMDMPSQPMSGSAFSPNAQTPNHGPSLRFVVSPGDEDSGWFNMPGGQSGHPLSPHFRDHHPGWLEGARDPLLPGEPVNRLLLVPPGDGR